MQIFADIGIAHVARPVCRQPESAGSIGSPGLAGPAAVGGRRIEDAEPLVLEIAAQPGLDLVADARRERRCGSPPEVTKTNPRSNASER
jgi:hypothetical protein